MGKYVKPFNEKRNDFDVKNKLNSLIDQQKSEFKNFTIRLKDEISNNKKATNILQKYINKENVSSDEINFFRKQCIEVIKTMGIGIPVILLPGGFVLLYFIMMLSNKFKINIIPNILKKNSDK